MYIQTRSNRIIFAPSSAGIGKQELIRGVWGPVSRPLHPGELWAKGTRELTPEEARALTVSGPFPEDASPAVAASSQREAAPSAPSSKASFEQHFMARFLDDRAFADAVTAYLVSLDGGEEEETLDSEVPGQMVMEEFANEGKGRQSVRRRGTNITI